MPHTFPIRVYYEDTDAGGIVYYANYLKFAERARTEALREAGYAHTRLSEEWGISFVVRSVSVDLRRPARLDERLTIETTLTDIGGASMDMRQVVLRNGEILVTLEVRLAAVGPNLLPARMPNPLRDSLWQTLALTSDS